MKKTFSLLLTLFLTLSMNAQYSWELGLTTGLASYQGDFTTTPVPGFNNSSFGLGVMGKYVFNYKWSVRPGVYFSSLKGDDFSSGDAWRENIRRASFSTGLTEISFIAEFEPFGEERYLGGRGFRKLISPYFFAGLGLAIIKPEPDFSMTSGSSSFLMKVGLDEDASKLKSHFVLPLGAGVKFDLSEGWYISLEMGARATFTDYLDGLSEAGNPEANDWYYFTGITVLHRLDGSMKN